MTKIKAGITLVVGLLILGLLASALLPTVINLTTAGAASPADPANVTFPPSDWGSIETTLWNLLPMAYVLGIFLFVIALALDQF